MGPKKKKIKFVIIILVFIIYFLIAARPVPRETVLTFNWLTSLPSGTIRYDFPIPENDLYENEEGEISKFIVSGRLLPFTLGSRFGYIDSSGEYALNQKITDEIYLSQNMWTEHSAEPSNIVINNILDNTSIIIDNPRGYPVLLDNRVFILGNDKNSLSEIGNNGSVLWTYEFGSQLTSIDVAAGLVLTGSLDGFIEVFNSAGERIFNHETGGSRYSVILGSSISRNGSHIGVICGIEPQRFLLFERHGESGSEYNLIHHEFLEAGFRGPVRILFIDNDRRVVFERENGIGCYNIKSKRGIYIPLEGRIAAIDESGDDGFFFLVISTPENPMDNLTKKLIGIRFPPDRLFGRSRTAALDTIFLRAPFKSEDVFIGRSRTFGSQTRGSQTFGSQTISSGSTLVVGGGSTLISFDLKEK